MTRGGLVLLSLILTVWCLPTACRGVVVSPATLRSSPYAEWAHYHWVWLSHAEANQSSMMAYAQDYLSHGVKVGAVDIDSGWSTGYNNFEFNTVTYPNASEMVEFFHSKNIRVILWATSMIDMDSSNYQEAHDKGYMIKDVLGQQAVISWWHGKGGLVDYTNPSALKWWHSQMDKALDLGIDGWKCDGTDPYILELVVPLGHGGVVTRKQYSDYYYGDFFNYTQRKLGKDRLIMSRPADGFGPIYLDFSPRYVMFSGWVGDDDPTLKGMESALKSYLQSAWAGYTNFGSDIGGYRTGNGPLGRTKEVLLRWAGLGAFSPLMENGGDKEHRPWMFDNTNETLHIYNRFVTAHYELVPYLLTTGTEAYERGVSSITPLARHQSFIDKIIADFKPSTLNYMLGSKLLVAPVHTNDTSSFVVSLPSGHTWLYWWDHSRISQGGTEVKFNGVPLDEIPVFLVNDTFIPLRMDECSLLLLDKRDYRTATPTSPFAGYLRWLMHSPHPGHGAMRSEVREEGGGGIVVTHWWESTSHLIVTISSHPSEQSLVEIAGLSEPLEAVFSQGEGGELTRLEGVSGAWELSEGGRGYMETCGVYCSVLIHPGRHGNTGHYLHLHF